MSAATGTHAGAPWTADRFLQGTPVDPHAAHAAPQSGPLPASAESDAEASLDPPATEADAIAAAAWDAVLEQLQGELTPQQFNAWIKPLSAVRFDRETNRLRVGAPNRFKLDWVRNQFANRIEAIAREHFAQRATSADEQPVDIEFFLETKAPNANPTPAPGVSAAASADAHKPRYDDAAPTRPAVPTSMSSTVSSTERSRMDPNHTFDRFVTGKANQLARAAAIQVADNPGRSYNPLFLHGGVGLGKTHLIQAVGNQMISRHPTARVRYINADQFVGDVVKAYQRKAFDQFAQIYHSLDLLLIDDIQFFSRKEGTQEQFFYAFEALTAAKKQIIITSDTYPAEMQGIDERLVSRFASGLTVAIEPPELEMRVAILLKKAEQEGRPLSDDVAFFVAKHSRSNIRELEGALKKLLAFASFHGRELTIDLAREALKDLLSAQRAQVSVESIQKTVADFYKIKVADMYSQRRPSNIARPRQIAMYFAKELTQKSLPEIGELFGGRDHTTVLHAVRKINELRGKHPELNHELHVLLQTLKG